MHALEAEEDGEECDGRFWRVYDVRRHIRVKHDLELGDREVRRLLVRAKAKATSEV